MQSRVIQAYQQAGFATLALEAKKEFVVRYGIKSEFQRVNSVPVNERVLPHVKRNLEELARHYHAVARRPRKARTIRKAVRWYRVYLDPFDDPRAPSMHFLLAELLFEDKHSRRRRRSTTRATVSAP